MDRGAWQATVHEVIKIGQDSAAKQQPSFPSSFNSYTQCADETVPLVYSNHNSHKFIKCYIFFLTSIML